MVVYRESREEDHFSSLNPHQTAEMRDVSARYPSISARVNDPILHRGQRAVPGAWGRGDKHSLACVNGLPSWVGGYLCTREGIKAEMQIAEPLPVNDKPLLWELSSMCLCNDGVFDAEIGQVAVRGNGLRPSSATSLNIKCDRDATQPRLTFHPLQPLNGSQR